MNKLITGISVPFRRASSFALSPASGIAPEAMAHRLMGEWQPTAEFWRQLVAPILRRRISRPYPFCLAYPLEGDVADLGDPAGWQIEWKWDGLRAQLIRRQWRTFLWSRGEELITDRFPELQALGAQLPEGTVIDGEILPWKDGAPLPFAQMQRRIGRKVLGPKILSEVPVVLVAYDLLELNGEDIRERPLEWRAPACRPSPSCLRNGARPPFTSPPGMHPPTSRESRTRKVEGLCSSRHRTAPAPPRRLVEVEDQSLFSRLVFIYAQPKRPPRQPLHRLHLRRMDDGKLVPFAKAYPDSPTKRSAK
jgi:DNA ligase-1